MNKNSILKKYFGYNEFGPLQSEIIEEVLKKRRTGDYAGRRWKIHLLSDSGYNAAWFDFSGQPIDKH
ncbi:MAG: hypothetical protein IPH28_22645 [Cytophagaceae bacterium]|nr:hypothetical protein [Cytophagaceae bacterium]